MTNDVTGDVRLRTLGGLALEGCDFGRTKPLLLLSYLCLEGKTKRRHLSELFWPDAKDPLASLSTDLSRLRKSCAEVVGADDAYVWTTLATDAGALLAASERGDFGRAVEAYEGPFLSGAHLNDWPVELETWVYSTREFLAERVCEAHVQLGEAAAKAGDFGEGARHAERACAVPGLGGLAPELMPRVHALLTADGHPHAKDLARAALDFGVTLSLEPPEAKERLRPASHLLPTQGTSFVGREAELEGIEKVLGEGQERLLSLVGLAGMGKTRLAVEAANRMIRQGLFRDGVYLVALESLSSASGLPYRVADAVGAELKGNIAPAGAIAERIGDGWVLLVLDNFEHLMDAATLLPELLGRCPNLKLLVTSRERLNLAEEFVLWLEGLPFEAETRRPDALTLFLERAARHRQRFEPSSMEAVTRICRAVGGSPFATELAAALVNTLSCEQIAAYLERDLLSLSSRARNLPERLRSVQAALESTWRLLTEDERLALERLSVFRGGFTRDAALQVADVGLSLLATLSDKALLRPQPHGRFDRHPLVYEFTKQKLSERPELAEAKRRDHAGYFTTFLEDRLRPIRGEQAKDVLNEISNDLNNIRGAWEYWLERSQAAELARSVFTLAYFFEFSGRCEEGLDLFSNMVRRLNAVPDTLPDAPLALGKLHYASSWMFDHLGQTHRALQAAEAALGHYRAHGDPTLIAHGLNNLAGFVADHKGDYQEAVRLLEEARGLVNQDDPYYEAVLLTNLGIMHLFAGDYAASEGYLNGGEHLHQKVDNQMGVAVCLQNRGDLFTILGRFGEAASVLKEGLALCEALGLEHFQPPFRCSLARTERLMGEVNEAFEHIASALKLAQEIDHQQAMPNILVEYARVALFRQDLEAASDFLSRALATAQQGGMLAKTLHVLTGFSEHYSAQRENALALELAWHVTRQGAAHALDRSLAQAVLDQAVANGAEMPEQPKDVSLEELISTLPTTPS